MSPQKSFMKTWKNWVDGKWVEGAGGQLTAIENPATGEKIAEVPNSTPADVDRAVEAAKRAFYDGRWTGLMRGERQRMLWRLGELVEQKAPSTTCVSSPRAPATPSGMKPASTCRITLPISAANQWVWWVRSRLGTIHS